MNHWVPFPLTSAFYCENALGRKNYARARALATPGEGTRPTGSRFFHSRWRTAVHGDSLGERTPRNYYAHGTHEPRRRDDVPQAWHLFPLTPSFAEATAGRPALSLGERENRRQSQSDQIVPVVG